MLLEDASLTHFKDTILNEAKIRNIKGEGLLIAILTILAQIYASSNDYQKENFKRALNGFFNFMEDRFG